MNLHYRFQQQAKLTPNALAVVDGEQAISYAQLDRITDLLAGFLQQQGLGRNKIAGIFVTTPPAKAGGFSRPAGCSGLSLPFREPTPTVRDHFTRELSPSPSWLKKRIAQ